MRAVVILFNGPAVSTELAEAIVSNFKFYGYTGEVELTTMDGTEIARAIVETQRPHFVSTEEGDNAVIAFRTMVPHSPNSLDFILKTMEYLTAGRNGFSKETEGFLRAASLISQEVPVSKSIADEYHYTKSVREKVREIYNKFMSN